MVCRWIIGSGRIPSPAVVFRQWEGGGGGRRGREVPPSSNSKSLLSVNFNPMLRCLFCLHFWSCLERKRECFSAAYPKRRERKRERERGREGEQWDVGGPVWCWLGKGRGLLRDWKAMENKGKNVGGGGQGQDVTLESCQSKRKGHCLMLISISDCENMQQSVSICLIQQDW